MRSNIAMPHKSEKDWEAENDARTMATAAVIRADKARYARAQVAAGKMADDQKVEAQAMAKIAGPKKKNKTKHRPSLTGKPMCG